MATTDKMDYEIPSYMVRPPTYGKWESVRLGIWNPTTKQFLGRTAKSWGGIILFYLIFYAALAALFAICIQGLYLSLNENSPTWQKDQSLIGDNPGMGFRPIAKDVETAGSLVWYVASDENSVKEWTDSLNAYLEPYTQKGGQNQKVCDYDNAAGDKVCVVEIDKWDPCTASHNYGFNNSKPCFFIKLNKIFGWQPEIYNDPSELPEDMPDDLKQHISSLNGTARNNIWVSCHGENPADKENIGPLDYFPKSRGFASYYYPFTNKKGYLSPLVAVQLTNPKLNVLINIECRAWAKNIRYSKMKSEREGSVHLEVLID
ncbi:sodium/potassium-transporting ATPase subunit beta-2 [Anabrus simplex]|uniref:sodium/potassium-transporting ATPase subunit beta-2 n=1 Tax=Anabrus simplex TaxID=316456 RepID=UPI0034DD704D